MKILTSICVIFVNIGSTKTSDNKNWINPEILYGPKSEECLNFIDARTFFSSLKVSWVKKCASDKLDDHWANNNDEKLRIRRRNRNLVLTFGIETLTDLVNFHLPYINGFYHAWLQFKTCFYARVTTTHNNLLHSPIFYNP